MGPMSYATIIDHPVLASHLAVLRDKHSPPATFRQSLAVATSFLAQAATADLAVEHFPVETPIEPTLGVRLTARIGLVPILRAGIGMIEPLLAILPTAEVWHLGVYRDALTAEPIHYYSKLPAGRPVDIGLVIDPMLATGGSVTLACQSLRDWGVRRLKVLSIIAARAGLDRVQEAMPDVEVYTCAVDPHLNDRKFIVPGLGDAGDRLFNTV